MSTRNPKPHTQNPNWPYIDDTLKIRMKKNTLANMVFFILSFPLMFVFTPFMLKYTGKEIFGMWAIIGTILVFAELLAGMQAPSALYVLVPKYDPQKKPQEINELINTMVFFFIFTSAVMAAAYLFLGPLLLKAFFKVSPLNAQLAKAVLAFSFYAFLINFIISGFSYLMCSFNVFYVLSIMHTVTAYVRFVLMVLALVKGFGLKGVVAAQMGTLILESIAALVYTKLVFPPLSFGPAYFKMKKLKEILGLSIKLFFAKAASLVNANIDKLVLGYFLNPVMAAYYQIGAGISRYITQVPEMLGLFSVMPAASELKARGMMEKIKVMFDRVNKYMFFLALFLMAGIIIFGREFTRLWLGDGYDQAYTVMMVLAFGYTCGLIGYASMNILNGLERTRETMTASLVSAFINIVLSAVLTWKMGLTGALIGTTISIITGSAMLFIMYYRILGHGIDVATIFIKPAVSAMIAFGLIYGVQTTLITGSNWFLFFTKALIFSLIYFILTVFVFRHFDEYDFNLLKGYLDKSKVISNKS